MPEGAVGRLGVDGTNVSTTSGTSPRSMDAAAGSRGAFTGVHEVELFLSLFPFGLLPTGVQSVNYEI